jgi:tetratricopeptide (TPR) repeat protein
VRERRARACRGMGQSLENEAPREALEWLRRGLAQVEGVSDREAAALYIKIGTVQLPLGEYDAAQAALDRGEALLPPGPSQLRINALNTLGYLHYTQGAFERGKAYTLQGLELCEQLHDDVRMANMLINLGAHEVVGGDWPGALHAYGRALDLAERTGSDRQRMFVDLNLGFLEVRTGDYPAALHHVTSGVELARAAGARVLEIAGLATLADLQLRQNNLAAASDVLATAERLAHAIDARAQLPELYRCRAEVSLMRGDTARALEDAERSVGLAQELKTDLEAGPSLRVLGQVLLIQGRHAEALDALARSQALLEGQDPYEAARTRLAWGRALLDSGAADQGASLLRKARAAFDHLGAQVDRAAAEALLR